MTDWPYLTLSKSQRLNLLDEFERNIFSRSYFPISKDYSFYILLMFILELLCTCIYCFSVAQLYPTPCDPMDGSTPNFLVLHYLPEFAQTHVHWIGDAIQPSHSLLPPSPPTFNLSQHQGLFQWVSSSHRWPKYWSFSFSFSPSVNIQGWFPLGLTDLILLSRHSQESFPTPPFETINFLALSFVYVPNLICMTTGKNSFGYTGLCQQSNISAF